MDKSSRLLGVVIGIIVAAAAASPSASATDQSLGTVTVIGHLPPPGGGGGGGGYFGGSSSTTQCGDAYNPCIEPPSAECSVMWEGIPGDCDPYQPPRLTVNGCTDPAPDFLVQAPHLGGVFTAGCNRHDECYGQFAANKDQCDIQIEQDMILSAYESMTPEEWQLYQMEVRGQAAMFATALRNPLGIVYGISLLAFNSAQKEAECRHHSWMMEQYACL